MSGLIRCMPTITNSQALQPSQFTYNAAHKSKAQTRKQQDSSVIRRAEARICARKTSILFPSALPGENATA